MKKTFFLFSVLLLCSFSIGCQTNTMSSDSSSLNEITLEKYYVPYSSIPTASEVAKAMGIGENLGNTMEAYDATNCEKLSYKWIPKVGRNTPGDYERKWGAVTTTQKVIAGMKAEGFDTVRIPVFWGNMMEDNGRWEINPDYIARVRQIVDYCQNEELYSVINIHHFDEFIIRRHNVDECVEIFTKLWTQIAEYFKDYPYTLVFEGFNEYLGGKQFNSVGKLVEPTKNQAYELTNKCNQAFVDAVRKTGGNNKERVLIVSGYTTNIDATSDARFIMPKDSATDKLMVSVHYVDNTPYWSSAIGGNWWKNYIDDQCNKLTKAFTTKNIPVFMGETSVNYPSDRFAADAPNKDSTACVEYVMKKLIDCGFVPVIWDVNDNYYSRTEYKIKKEQDREMIKRLKK